MKPKTSCPIRSLPYSVVVLPTPRTPASICAVPPVLVVMTGTAVDFPNSDQVRHQVYSFSPAKSFEIKLYSGDAPRSIQFDKPGTVILGCNIHDWMLGYILVLFAMRLAPVSHVAPAREVSMLFAALLGGHLLGEGDRVARLLGAACIAIGVMALALG